MDFLSVMDEVMLKASREVARGADRVAKILDLVKCFEQIREMYLSQDHYIFYKQLFIRNNYIWKLALFW